MLFDNVDRSGGKIASVNEEVIGVFLEKRENEISGTAADLHQDPFPVGIGRIGRRAGSQLLELSRRPVTVLDLQTAENNIWNSPLNNFPDQERTRKNKIVCPFP